MTEEFDIKTHKFVPEHTKLTEDEKAKLLKELNVKIINLPRILTSDAAIQHLDPKGNEVIKIERFSPTSEKTIFYRRVING